MVFAVLPFLLLVCYYFMDRKHVKSASSPRNKHAGVSYTALDTNGKIVRVLRVFGKTALTCTNVFSRNYA